MSWTCKLCGNKSFDGKNPISCSGNGNALGCGGGNWVTHATNDRVPLKAIELDRLSAKRIYIDLEPTIKVGKCPKCNSDKIFKYYNDTIYNNEIHCGECGYVLRGIFFEFVVERWNKLKRKTINK